MGFPLLYEPYQEGGEYEVGRAQIEQHLGFHPRPPRNEGHEDGRGQPYSTDEIPRHWPHRVVEHRHAKESADDVVHDQRESPKRREGKPGGPDPLTGLEKEFGRHAPAQASGRPGKGWRRWTALDGARCGHVTP